MGDVQTGSLQNNGGTAASNALLTGSVAIDAGDSSLLPPSDTTDQRGTGFVRVFGGNVDVGAFEFQLPVITGGAPPQTSSQVPRRARQGDP